MPSTQHAPPHRRQAARQVPRVLRAGLFPITLIALSACGGDSPPPAATSASAPVPPKITASTPVRPEAVVSISGASLWPERDAFDFSKHVPNDAVAYFEASSIRELEEAILRIQAIAGIAAEQADIGIATRPISLVGVDPSRLDRGARIGLAYAPVEGQALPSPIVIAPALDEGPVTDSPAMLMGRGMRSRRVESGYVVIEHAGSDEDAPRGGSPLVHDLPAGLVQGRFSSEVFAPLLAPPLHDLADRLNESYRLSRPRTSSSQLYQFDANEAIRFLTELDVVALGLGLTGDKADLRLRVARQADAPAFTGTSRSVSETLGDLAHHVDTTDPLSFLFALDSDTSFDEFCEALAGASLERGLDLPGLHSIDAKARRAIESAASELFETFRPGAAVSVFLEPAKAHVAIYLSAKNELRVREAISLFLSRCELETWGFEMALPIRSMLDRTLIEDYSVRFDSRRLDFDQRARMRSAFKTYLGASSLHLKVATSGNQVLIVLGGDTAAVNARLRDFDANGMPHPDITAAVESMGGASAATVLHTDLVKLVGQIAGIGAVSSGRSVAEAAREISRRVGEARAPFTFWSGTIGSEDLFGTTFDLEAVARTFDAFMGSGL